MSITVVCPNGHSLKVKDCCAGSSGLCPICRASIKVPRPARGTELSDDDIMGILGPPDPSRKRPLPAGAHEAPGSSAAGRFGLPVASPPKKSCEKCHAEIIAGTHICPHCHTYIANLNRL